MEGMAEETVMGAKEILAGALGESPGGRRVSSSRSGAQAGLGEEVLETRVNFKTSLWHFGSFRICGFLIHMCSCLQALR